MSPSIQVCVASNLVDYFVNLTHSNHYAITLGLRQVVGESNHAAADGYHSVKK